MASNQQFKFMSLFNPFTSNGWPSYQKSYDKHKLNSYIDTAILAVCGIQFFGSNLSGRPWNPSELIPFWFLFVVTHNYFHIVPELAFRTLIHKYKETEEWMIIYRPIEEAKYAK